MLYPVDLERFWHDNAESMDRPFDTTKPQDPMSLRTTEGCIWQEFGIPFNPDYYHDEALHLELNRRYNDRAEEIVGLRILPEFFVAPEDREIRPMRIEEIFGSRIDTIEGSDDIGGADWVRESVHTIQQLEERMEYVESLNLREVIFPEGLREDLQRIEERTGFMPRVGVHIRGPVTAAMSICGVENIILWLYDYPEVMERFRDLFAAKIVEWATLQREFAGVTEHGFSFADDNCAMLNAELYDRFGLPILRHVFGVFCPDEGDRRYQHSDSAMGHLLPALNSVGLTDGNFGPTVRPGYIRQQMPRTVIHGQLPPFTFSRGTPEEIYLAVKSDIEESGHDGGLIVTTAGSVNPGSKLEGLRAAMYAIQQHGRYA